MPKMRTRMRSCLRFVVRWKVIFDVITLTLPIILYIAFLFPDLVQINKSIINFWFGLLVTFFVAREAGRWVGDHKSGEYRFSWIAHGELYLIIFASLPFIMALHQMFTQMVLTQDQMNTLNITIALGVKVAIIYFFTAVSKKTSQKNKHLVDKLSQALNSLLGSSSEDPPTDVS